MGELLDRANRFVTENKNKIDTKNRLHFHYMAPIGWINDPNGLSFFKGKYHLFYQYYPYQNIWGPMYWGHAESRDGIAWDTQPIALSPDYNYDRNGCFSGSAIEKDGRLYLFYTGNIEGDNPEQNQNIAWTDDGENYTKYESNPVISTPPPEGSKDFRDPKVERIGDKYYMFIGTKKGDVAKLAIYISTDLLEWQYSGIAFEDNDGTYDMWECPDLFQLDSSFVLITSPMKKGENILPVYYLGDFDKKIGRYIADTPKILDYGTDFYAPQTFCDDKGRRLMIAWMNIWQTKDPLENDQWRGAMTVTRELTLDHDQLVQYPVSDIENYRYDEHAYHNVVLNKQEKFTEQLTEAADFLLKINLRHVEAKVLTFGIKSSADGSERTTLQIDLEKKWLFGSRKDNFQGEKTDFDGPLNLINDELEVRMLIDTNSLEIFVNRGRTVFTTRIYNKKTSQNFTIEVDEETAVFEEIKWWKMRSVID